MNQERLGDDYQALKLVSFLSEIARGKVQADVQAIWTDVLLGWHRSHVLQGKYLRSFHRRNLYTRKRSYFVPGPKKQSGLSSLVYWWSVLGILELPSLVVQALVWLWV